MGASGPVGCSYDGWRAALELHPDGLWTWEVFRDLQQFEAELLRWARARARQQDGATTDVERRILDTYGDDLAEELDDDGEEDPHRGRD